MTDVDQPQFVTDPHTVICEVVARIEPELDPAEISAAVGDVVRLKPRMRALAEALDTDPELLTSGRPEGPKLVGMLIRALQERGATRVVPPRCAGCGKQHKLTSLDRKNRRICGWCAIKRREAVCGKCGRKTGVVYRDRDELRGVRAVHRPPTAILWTRSPATSIGLIPLSLTTTSPR